MFIGNVKIDGLTALAPMAGVADTAFRLVCKEQGAPYVVGEMASARGLLMSDKKTARLLAVAPAERPMAVQLFGDDPDVMAEAAKRAESFGPDIIDINMGCPAPKVASNGGGSALMKNLPLAGRIIEATAKAVHVPVTVKMRKGWDDGHVCAVELAHIAEECGAAAVTVHGRTRKQMYAPPVDLSIIAAVKSAVNIPVIGNGDVRSPEDARRMLDETGCDLVMIGRGALGAPWLFRQTEEYLKTGEYAPAPPFPERLRLMRRQIEMLCEQAGERAGMREARRHAAWYLKGIRGASSLRGEAVRMETLDDLERLSEKALQLAAEGG